MSFFFARSDGVVVITRASHARGPEFDPRVRATFFFFFGVLVVWRREEGVETAIKKRKKKPLFLFSFVSLWAPFLPKVVVGILA